MFQWRAHFSFPYSSLPALRATIVCMVNIRSRWKLLLPALLILSMGTLAFGQETPIQVRDSSVLKPPPGAKIALVEFMDLECPVCGHYNPIIEGAVAKYKLPWIHYSFPLPEHNWSFPAAVYAQWFQAKSYELGNEYRNFIYANQFNIETKSDLRNWTEKFAQQKKIALPFAIDPQGTYAAKVKADMALGDRMGVYYTPTLWIVTNDYSHGKNYVQVTNFYDLYTMLDQAEARVGNKVP